MAHDRLDHGAKLRIESCAIEIVADALAAGETHLVRQWPITDQSLDVCRELLLARFVRRVQQAGDAIDHDLKRPPKGGT